MEAGVRRDLPGGEADVAHSHSEGLAAARRGAEQGLLGHLAEDSDDGHVGVWGKEKRLLRTSQLRVYNESNE